LREFRTVRSDLERLSLGAWFAELTETLTVEDVAAPEVLRLLLNSLYALEELDRPQKLVKAVFELKLMALSGFAPLVQSCAVCDGEPELPRLHLQQGVLHCAACRDQLGPGISMPLDGAALAAMRHVLYGEERRLFSFRLPEVSLQRLSAAAEAYTLTQLERGFRTLDFYKQISQLG
jgi:DNA repair protein RecO (recombination protein O)